MTVAYHKRGWASALVSALLVFASAGLATAADTRDSRLADAARKQDQNTVRALLAQKAGSLFGTPSERSVARLADCRQLGSGGDESNM